MKDIDFYENEWENDSNIFPENYETEALKVPKLHHKYYVYYNKECDIVTKLEASLKILKFKKYNFYFYGPDEETQALGWNLPPRGKITLKQEVQEYVETDEDVIKLSYKISQRKKIVEFLESIINMIKFRNQTLQLILEMRKFVGT